jgi:tetratricopeptide (TPR) repeat protein
VFHYLSAHDFAAAEPDIINAVTGMPNNPLPHSYLGFIRRRQGRWTEAAEHLERAATIEPENMNTLVSLNHAYNALRQRESSERAIRRAAAADPDAAEPALLDALLILGYNGDLLGCIAALQRLRSLHPDDELIAYYLEFYFHTQGRFEDASKLLESGQGVLLGVPGLREMELGWALREAGHQTAANRWFEAALSQLDTKGTHWRRTDLAFNSNMRAYTLLGLGRTDEALAAFRSALSESPRTRDEVDWSTIAYYGFGLLGRSGDVPGALELVRQMLDPPSRFLPNQIWFHWAAAPLRTNPEFRELMARHGVDVTRDPRAEYAAQQASATGAQ